MRPNDGRVSHQTFQVGIVGTESKERLKNVLVTPARKAFVDAVPRAIGGRQESPLCAAAGDPQDSGDELAAFPLRADIDVGAGPQKC